MADRKQFVIDSKPNMELAKLLEAVKEKTVSEEILQEQRISFVFGNALNREFVTKDSVRHSSQNIRIKA